MVTRERGISVVVIKLESNTVMNGSTKRLVWWMSFEGNRKAEEYISSMDDAWIYQMIQLYICIFGLINQATHERLVILIW